MFGRILISLISCVRCDFLAWLAFFCASYLKRPTSRNLATGGSAFGETSTRSRPAALRLLHRLTRVHHAQVLALSIDDADLGDWMNSLYRGPDLTGGAMDRRGMGGAMSLYSWIDSRVSGEDAHPRYRGWARG